VTEDGLPQMPAADDATQRVLQGAADTRKRLSATACFSMTRRDKDGAIRQITVSPRFERIRVAFSLFYRNA
jgi:hypothetical protein